jgi:hypothetical protein
MRAATLRAITQVTWMVSTSGYDTGYTEGNSTGFTAGYQAGVEGLKDRVYTLRDPTYSEALRFLRRDATDRIDYHLGSFVCHDYSTTVKVNAFKEGIHCYYVSLEFPEPPGHAIVAFNTTDRGLVFFEPQEDKEMDVDLGIRYFRDNGNYVVDYDDTIVGFDLVW